MLCTDNSHPLFPCSDFTFSKIHDRRKTYDFLLNANHFSSGKIGLCIVIDQAKSLEWRGSQFLATLVADLKFAELIIKSSLWKSLGTITSFVFQPTYYCFHYAWGMELGHQIKHQFSNGKHIELGHLVHFTSMLNVANCHSFGVYHCFTVNDTTGRNGAISHICFIYRFDVWKRYRLLSHVFYKNIVTI